MEQILSGSVLVDQMSKYFLKYLGMEPTQYEQTVKNKLSENMLEEIAQRFVGLAHKGEKEKMDYMIESIKKFFETNFKFN